MGRVFIWLLVVFIVCQQPGILLGEGIACLWFSCFFFFCFLLTFFFFLNSLSHSLSLSLSLSLSMDLICQSCGREVVLHASLLKCEENPFLRSFSFSPFFLSSFSHPAPGTLWNSNKNHHDKNNHNNHSLKEHAQQQKKQNQH